MRNFYGKWNENRWLASVRSKFFKQSKAPARYKDQPYARHKWSKKLRKNPRQYNVRNTKLVYPNEKAYDRRDGLEKKMSRSLAEFVHQVPIEDPYYDFIRNKLDGGADIRWQSSKQTAKTSTATGTTERKNWVNFLMSVDLGLRYRPMFRKLHFVYESRFTGIPKGKRKAEEEVRSFQRRSAYVMLDDLTYNTYVMAGYYRPMFGLNSPDHTSLSQIMQSNAIQGKDDIYDLQFEVFSAGGSPNVPYANLHFITKQLNTQTLQVDSSTKGVVLNLGARFVTLGASINYNYWLTQRNAEIADEAVTPRLQMHSISGGIQLYRLTSNIELVGIAKDVPNSDFRKGLVMTSDNFYRIWREIYYNLQIASANVAKNLAPGKGWQIRHGLRGFAYPGVDLSLHYGITKNEFIESRAVPEPSDTVLSEWMAQIHLYM